MKSKKVIWVFFLALSLFYLSLSPGAVTAMGYMGDNLKATSQIVSNLLNWLSLEPATPIDWPRHGFLELVFEVPFVLLSRALFGNSPEWADRILAIEPVLATSLLCTIIFKWVHKITSSLIWSYAIGLAAGLGTMLWPYAYIGLETTQSLFLLLAAYLVLGSERAKNWVHTVLFALSCAVAISVKSTGVFLVPAVGFLIFIYFRRGPTGIFETLRSEWRKLLLTGSIIVIIFWLSAYTRSLFWTKLGFNNQVAVFFGFAVDSPVVFLMNVFSFFGSVNKGLIVYCPIIMLVLLGLRRAYREHQHIVIFTLLSLAGLIGAFSLLIGWSDEVWGPRWVHSSIAPLMICFALTRRTIPFRVRKEIPFLALGVLGTAISFLGSFFYYGSLHQVSERVGQNTLENLQYNKNWNHVRFNLKLFQVWTGAGIETGKPVTWPPAEFWLWQPPPDARPLNTIDMREYAYPQPELMKTSKYSLIFASHLLSLLLGSALLLWSGWLAAREEALPGQLELPGLIT